jgi:hypothetical protein
VSVALADPAPIGHNAPPSPFDAIKVHIEDLLVEAHNWADGTVVETQAQADEASRLVDDLRKAAKAAEDLRVEEKAPFDAGLAEIQGRYNPLIQDPKTKNPGKVWKAIDALKATVKPYLDKLDAEKRAAAAAAQAAADEAARVAAEAMRAAAVNDLGAREAAEALVEEARLAASAASRASNDKAQARGGDRAMGLTRTWTAVMADRKAALVHYLTTQPDTVVAFLQGLAEADVRAGKRQIPGFDVIEGTRL